MSAAATQCKRCGKVLQNGRGGCEGAQHGNRNCAMNGPAARVACTNEMPSDTRFAVDVAGRPRQYFDNMMDALTYASRALYMGPDTWRAACNALRAGRTFDFAYGFTDATIWPPQNLDSKTREAT